MQVPQHVGLVYLESKLPSLFVRFGLSHAQSSVQFSYATTLQCFSIYQSEKLIINIHIYNLASYTWSICFYITNLTNVFHYLKKATTRMLLRIQSYNVDAGRKQVKSKILVVVHIDPFAIVKNLC